MLILSTIKYTNDKNAQNTCQQSHKMTMEQAKLISNKSTHAEKGFN